MPKYQAESSVFHTSKDCIPPGAVFDPEQVGLSADSIKGLLAGGYIRPAAEGAAITYPTGPAAEIESPKEKKPTAPNVAATLELIAAAQTIEELDKLAEGEERKSVVPAIEKRRAELTPPAE